MSGNPFEVTPIVPDMSDTIMGLGRLGLEKQRMINEDTYRQGSLANEQDYKKGVLEQGQQGLDIRKQEVNVRTPPSQRPWDESNVTKMKNQLRLKGLDPDKMPDVFEPLEAMAKDKSMMRGDVAGAIEQGWDTEFKPRIINNLGAQSEALAKKAANMKEDDPARNKVLAEMKKLENMQSQFAQIKPEHVVPGFFSDIAEERANTKAALAALKAEEKPTILPSGAIALDKKGNVIKRNPRPANEKMIQVTDENGDEVWIPQSQAAGKKIVKKAGKKSLADILGQGSNANDPLGIRK